MNIWYNTFTKESSNIWSSLKKYALVLTSLLKKNNKLFQMQVPITAPLFDFCV